METAALATINPCIPTSLWQASPPILQAAIKTAGRINSLPEIVGLRTEPKIATLQQKGGERAIFGVVKALLVAMNNNLHIDNSLTEANINNLARQLTTNDEVRWWLTLADIDLLCRQIVQGRFGKFYNHFSENEFNECLAKYCHERSELHRINADKNVCDVQAVQQAVGYTIDHTGRIQVPEDRVGVKEKKPQRYLYDEKGNIKGENPAYWTNAKRMTEKSPKEMEKINLFNKKMEIATRLMSEKPDLKFVNAVALAEIELRKQ